MPVNSQVPHQTNDKNKIYFPRENDDIVRHKTPINYPILQEIDNTNRFYFHSKDTRRHQAITEPHRRNRSIVTDL